MSIQGTDMREAYTRRIESIGGPGGMQAKISISLGRHVPWAYNLWLEEPASSGNKAKMPFLLAIDPTSGMISEVCFFCEDEPLVLGVPKLEITRFNGPVLVSDERFKPTNQHRDNQVRVDATMEERYSEGTVYAFRQGVEGPVEAYALDDDDSVLFAADGTFAGIIVRNLTQGEKAALLRAGLISDDAFNEDTACVQGAGETNPSEGEKSRAEKPRAKEKVGCKLNSGQGGAYDFSNKQLRFRLKGFGIVFLIGGIAEIGCGVLMMAIGRSGISWVLAAVAGVVCAVLGVAMLVLPSRPAAARGVKVLAICCAAASIIAGIVGLVMGSSLAYITLLIGVMILAYVPRTVSAGVQSETVDKVSKKTSGVSIEELIGSKYEMRYGKQCKMIQESYVPKSGAAEVLQGELLRELEKLRYEAQNNGNVNWDDDYDYFCDFIKDTLCSKAYFLPVEEKIAGRPYQRLR